MTEHLADRFELVLKLRGWRTASPGHLTKGNWQIIFDTSSWMMLQNASTHIFDVAVPDAYRGPWTANLIEHPARIEDERARLRAALSAIRDHPGAGPSVQSAASAALAECYHTWLGGTLREQCSICGAQRQRSAETVAAEWIATARSQLWAVTRDDVRQSLADHLDRAQADLSEHPQQAADELVAFVHELQANPHGAIPEPAAEDMTAVANLASALLKAEVREEGRPSR